MWNNNSGKIGAYSQIREIFMPRNFLRMYTVVDYLHKSRMIFSHAYRLNHQLEQPEHWYSPWFKIRGVSFGT